MPDLRFSDRLLVKLRDLVGRFDRDGWVEQGSDARFRLEDRMGHRIAQRLYASEKDLSPIVAERLRSARLRALTIRRTAPAPTPLAFNQATKLLLLENARLFRVALVMPLLVLAIGLFAISEIQEDQSLKTRATVDLEILTDSLPPSAFTDPGFVEFLKRGEARAIAR